MAVILIIILSLWALNRWKNGDKVSFYLIIQFFALKTYNLAFLLTSTLRPDDMALIMVLITFFVNSTRGNLSKPPLQSVYLFIAFIALSSLVSLSVYDIPLLQIFKGARNFLLVLALPDIMTIRKDALKDLLHRIFLFNMVFGVIFIFQTFTQISILRDMDEGVVMTGYLGLKRFYSFPPLIPFCCLYSLYLFPKNRKFKKLCLAISFLTLLIIQSRGMMLYTTLLIVVASFLFKSSPIQKTFVYMLIAMAFIIIVKEIFSGETGGKTMNDMNLIFSSNGALMERPEGDATLAYRLWLVNNSISGLNSGTIFQQIFGLGLFVVLPLSYGSSLNILGAARINRDMQVLLTNPDISYATLLNLLGYVGFVLYMYIFIEAILYFKRKMKDSDFAKIGMLYILFLLAVGMNSADISTSTCFIVPFILISISNKDTLKLN